MAQIRENTQSNLNGGGSLVGRRVIPVIQSQSEVHVFTRIGSYADPKGVGNPNRLADRHITHREEQDRARGLRTGSGTPWPSITTEPDTKANPGELILNAGHPQTGPKPTFLSSNS